eukprot:gene15967-18933_t
MNHKLQDLWHQHFTIVAKIVTKGPKRYKACLMNRVFKSYLKRAEDLTVFDGFRICKSAENDTYAKSQERVARAGSLHKWKKEKDAEARKERVKKKKHEERVDEAVLRQQQLQRINEAEYKQWCMAK